VYACSKVTGERGHPLESYKYQFFARPNISRRSHQAPVLQPRNCINFLPLACICRAGPAGILPCCENPAAAFDMRTHTYTRRHQQAARQKQNAHIGFAPQQKKGSDAFAWDWEAEAPPLQAMAAAVFICLQFFYDTLDSLELNTTRLIFTLMAVKTREPRRLQQITAQFSAYKKYDKRSAL
jgi:hypothetical protein